MADRQNSHATMFRLLLFLSLFPIALALAARWWFGLRVLISIGKQSCRCNLERWFPSPGDESIVHRAENTSEEFGRELRTKALAEWAERDPKAAASREGTRRFGMAVPPLTGIIVVFAVIVGKVPIIGAFAILLTATALSAALGLLTLPPELSAISKTARRIREDRSFPAGDDGEAVARCAVAHAWEQALPPILRWIHKS